MINGNGNGNGREWTIRILVSLVSLSVGLGSSAFWLSSKVEDNARVVAVNAERLTLLNTKHDSDVSVINERIYRLTNLMEELVKQNTTLIARLDARVGKTP